jgi:hypothetical protein
MAATIQTDQSAQSSHREQQIAAAPGARYDVLSAFELSVGDADLAHRDVFNVVNDEPVVVEVSNLGYNLFAHHVSAFAEPVVAPSAAPTDL